MERSAWRRPAPHPELGGDLRLLHHGLGIALVDGLVAWSNFGDLVVRPFRPEVVVETA
jgi:hypothetical protein